MMTIHALPLWLREITEIKTNTHTPNWLVVAKQKAWDKLINTGMPTRRQENYKYTDFSFLADKQFILSQQTDVGGLSDYILSRRLKDSKSICLVMVNGVFQSSLSDLENCPTSIIAMSLAKAIDQHPELIQQTLQNNHPYYFAELNHALFTDGLFLHVADHATCDLPIHILSIITEQRDCLIVPKNIFSVGKHAKINVLEEYVSLHPAPYLHNVVADWELQAGAVVHYCKKQHENNQAAHFAHTFIEQRQGSQFDLVNVTTGGIFSRDNIFANLSGVDANCLLSGFYNVKRASQYVDHHIEINHLAAHSASEMLYKGILDQASRVVFNGRLHVAKDAQRIKAYQANHHLLLSSEAEAYSKPELVVYADDVKCKHGATSGQIDEDALFYLQSRGIEKSSAIAILMQGFAEEILKRIHHPEILARMQEMI